MSFKQACDAGRKSFVECFKHGGSLDGVSASNRHYCEKEGKDRLYNAC